MKEISILDKTFVESISEINLQARIADLGRELNRDYADKDPLVVSVLNGAVVFTADLLRHFSFPHELQFIRLSSYHGGMETSGQITPLLDLRVNLVGRDVLILEDIVDTGNTLAWLRNYLLERGVASVKMATLLFKHEVFRFAEPPEYCCFRIPNEFVVGFGLDYAERGRQLRSIYKLKV
jgi:hypoxanthine phosphoribosyltransferase